MVEEMVKAILVVVGGHHLFNYFTENVSVINLSSADGMGILCTDV